ncbi:DUF3099 domain-containing protein [Isoptericola sp. b441]|uniref:DUF3099 domain-containing protein n=1 Tax=Actinotalea lenta TaxID=3064654 RepID=A0ABT9D9D0_9CELL|nr:MULTISPECIES: DUF3099 domain-containing protein [unclassified Isoptericola]MDO8107509.1 DUF3099 domain-containing protein [Isoptericola sp. b441]MDO8120831.1 DUF3099 domain-containing protein [Isoptericola sp. b490]
MRRPGRARGRGTSDVPRITSAREPLSDDLSRRTRRYLIQMGIRVVCFIGAVLVDGWFRWVLVAGAVVLPYVAVVLANAGRTRGEEAGTFVEPRHIEAGKDEDDGEH